MNSSSQRSVSSRINKNVFSQSQSPLVHHKELINNLFQSLKKTKKQCPLSKRNSKVNIFNSIRLDDKSNSTNDSQQTEQSIIKQQKQYSTIEDKYKILQFLGKGQFSKVHLAKELKSEFHVALKVMNKSSIQPLAKSISQEIKIQYLLNHPNLVKLYTFFQTNDQLVLVLEYCSHGQLLKVLRSIPEQCFSEEVASNYIKQVTSALAYLHRNNIIHRDVKPENIYISYNQVKLADFTNSIYSPEMQRQTQCGSLAYLSPEIVKGQSYDKSTDMWSLGVLAFELCSGETPWEDCSHEEMQFLISKASVKIPSNFSKLLKDFIQNLVTVDPKLRMSAKQALQHPWLMMNDDKQQQLFF